MDCKTLVIGRTQYNLDSIKKYSKSKFEKVYGKKIANWEDHWDQIQATKGSKSIEK